MTARKPRPEPASGDRGEVTPVRQRRKRGSGSEPMRSIRIADPLWAAIQLRAVARNVSVSEYVREIVTRDVARAGKRGRP